MKTRMLIISLLLLSILIHETQGIRLLKDVMRKPNTTPTSTTVAKKDDDRAASKSDQDSSSSSPKLKAESNTTENISVEPESEHTDVLDIAGMDYSPARRKPPVHN
ncbi:uncharacterized protein LOC127239878 [Andrographis paniculata]|uniref:uncharacterized protein LOC127239878 n=1 Tax=Andrographis paniculata TaxID=175694 RepID=UPI0021E85ACF|nr:uncharacterized protein LOC127239878 [Andrographis paniculata]